MPLNPDEVRNKQFSTTRLKQGYDEGEVDAFLDDLVAPEMERLTAEIRALRGPLALTAADAAPGQAPTVPVAEQASLLLVLAEKTAEEYTSAAKAEADDLLTRAEAQATALEQDARDRHSVSVASLEVQRATLERRVEDLRTYEREYRTRLKAYLESQMRELDGEGENAEPDAEGPTPPGGAPVAPDAGVVPGAALTDAPAQEPAGPPREAQS